MSLNSSRSNNSGGKSKNSNNSNEQNKKRKTNQKTLGVAWGANSISSSKSASRNSPFSDFGSYMVEKNRKLRNQFDVDASGTSLGDSGKPLFHGVTIFVDGFTVPSSQELRSYMLKYGGRFENYFSRHRVTHIICSNLPDSKLKNIRSFSGGLPVVKPMWIVDSVAANKLLNWVPYQLDQLVELSRQPKLSAFFPLKSNTSSEGAETPSNHHVKLETARCLSNGLDTSKDISSSEAGDSVENSAECSGESVFSGDGTPFDVKREEQNSMDSEENCSEGRATEPRPTDVDDETKGKMTIESSPLKSSVSGGSYCSDKQTLKGSEQNIAGVGNPRHSTLGDPNFVKNYFKYSRLHFIGTWRNRYRKRFPSGPGCSVVSAPKVSQKVAIIHVDMDCFFVSVVIKSHPELRDKPVAVCHSDNPKGTAEISSANYPARDFGVRAGIFVRDAKALCPHLVILPYNFEAYEEVADQFYDILHKHCNKVQAVSCDEAFLDVTDREDEDPEHLASRIRQEIVDTTGCTASAGVAGNLLMARLATRTAKPDGQCYIPPDKVDNYLSELPIKALPGIGRVLEDKLKTRFIQTCSQLRMIPKESLQKDFGEKTGDMLFNYCRGIDNRAVGLLQETKSVGADVNWGVRFNDTKDSQNFLLNLCNEVSLRLQGCGVQGRTITLKVKKRRKDAGEPTKYMGCGDCENLSHSMTVPVATDDAEVLQRISKQLFGSFHIDVKEIRGVGLHVSKLENADVTRQGLGKNALTSWLASAPADMAKLYSPAKERGDGGSREAGPSHQLSANQSRGEARLSSVSMLPPISQLDMGVIDSLPPDLFSEVNEMYDGKLSKIIKKTKTKASSSGCTSVVEDVKGVKNKGKEPVFSHSAHVENTIDTSENKEKEFKRKNIQLTTSFSRAGSLNAHITTSGEDRNDIMPASLSQVDMSVLEELPEEVKADILESLHRRPGCSSDSNRSAVRESPHASKSMGHIQMTALEFASENSLWNGNPPVWVNIFKNSGDFMLNILGEMYHKSFPTGLLSSILQATISLHSSSLDTFNEGKDDSINSLCELFKQYIGLKIKYDIEEIYICFRLLRRFAAKSTVFIQVIELTHPYLQAAVSEHYGGNLNISYGKE
ncbi:DNA repair protein REV1-like [Papaver somniferum]|uniref:DNA repair protein REV1-like n=1 Tax=Papaver somniferum TaxID=3469 RepID=UPI000E70403F|nr:DNA repair protein REV1-like [Papaver somniferum]